MSDATTHPIAAIEDDQVRHLVARFAEMNRPWYSTQCGADGECRIATMGFIHLLSEQYGRAVRFEHNAIDWFVAEDDRIEGPEVPHPYFQNLPQSYWRGHTCIRIGDWYIDFTARQFNPEAPYPLIWRA